MGPPYHNLALLPARGGSKSIPKKNIAPLGGQPLISYGLGEVKRSSFVQRVVVDTDDAEIAEVARRYGAETPYVRPAHLAQDNTSTLAVIEHAIEWLKSNEGYAPDYILLVQPSDPFVRAEQIDELFRLVVDRKADSGITMIEVPRIFHPYHVRKMTEDGYLEFDQPELHYRHPNRQSDPKRYAFANAYWFRTEAFMREKKMEVGKRVGLLVDGLSAHDINEPLDLAIAEAILPLRQSPKQR
jgi:CMP-N,N'-diacetyllegionaminic acid synthase